MPTGFLCKTCGEYHNELPLCFGPSAPALWFSIPESERERRCSLSTDQCIVDEEYYFVLGRLEIPIVGQENAFTWLAWVSLSEKSFDRASSLWNKEGRESEPPYFGWLSSSLPYEPTTMNLKVNLHTCPVGERPYIEIQECNHPLYQLQNSGMQITEAQQLAERLLHGAP